MTVRSYLIIVLGLWLSNNLDDAYIIKTPKDTEALIGYSTFLNCSLSDASAPIQWCRYPVGKRTDGLTYVYTNGIILDPYHLRFRVDNDSSTGAFNLVIEKVEARDAGLYVCQNGLTMATAQLIILESSPECSSNIDSRGFIGSNSCGLEKDTIQISCGIRYSGNIVPELKVKRQQGQSSILLDQICNVYNGQLVCNYTVEADIEFNGTSFICETDRSEKIRQNCTTETVIIHSAIANRTRIAKFVGDVVICPTNESPANCSYKWLWYDFEHQETVSDNKTLSVKKQGLHRCEATCRFKESDCIFVPMAIEASVDKVMYVNANSTTNVALPTVLSALTFTVVLSIAIFLAVIYFHRYATHCKRKNAAESADEKTVSNANEHELQPYRRERNLSIRGNPVSGVTDDGQIENSHVPEAVSFSIPATEGSHSDL